MTEEKKELAENVILIAKHLEVEPAQIIEWYSGMINLLAMGKLPVQLGEWTIAYIAGQLPGEEQLEATPPAPHLNPPDHLPPVDCSLILDVDGELVRGRRTGFIHNKDREMSYELDTGETVTGRFPWTYP